MIVSEMPWWLRLHLVDEEVEARLAEARQLLRKHEAVRSEDQHRCVRRNSDRNQTARDVQG